MNETVPDSALTRGQWKAVVIVLIGMGIATATGVFVAPMSMPSPHNKPHDPPYEMRVRFDWDWRGADTQVELHSIQASRQDTQAFVTETHRAAALTREVFSDG